MPRSESFAFRKHSVGLRPTEDSGRDSAINMFQNNGGRLDRRK